MLLKAVGNICVGLAILLYLIPLPALISAPPDHDGGQSQTWGIIFMLLPMWFCLAIGLCASNATGGLNRLSMSKGARYSLILITCLAMAVVTGLSGILRHETADQIPWAVRPLVPWGWAMWAFPPVIMIFCLLTINPGIGAAVPPRALRWPPGVVAGVSVLVSCGLLLQWFVSSQQRQAARIDGIVSEDAERTRRSMDEVRALDASKDLLQLLGYTNRFNDAKLRELALAKVRTVPDLEEQLAAGLRSPGCEPVLIFLDASDPPANQPLAEPARDAFVTLAGRVHEGMRDGGTLYPDSFEYDARLILSVADKFRGLGVDYAPAIRAYRSALDAPHQPNIKFNCASALDRWLARDAKPR